MALQYLREYDQHDEDHVSRKDRLRELPSGPKLLLDAFECILTRVRTTRSVARGRTLTRARRA
jgi:hypothetical protein